MRASTSASSSVMRTRGMSRSTAASSLSAAAGVTAASGLTLRLPPRSSTPSSVPRFSEPANRRNRQSSSLARPSK